MKSRDLSLEPKTVPKEPGFQLTSPKKIVINYDKGLKTSVKKSHPIYQDSPSFTPVNMSRPEAFSRPNFDQVMLREQSDIKNEQAKEQSSYKLSKPISKPNDQMIDSFLNRNVTPKHVHQRSISISQMPENRRESNVRANSGFKSANRIGNLMQAGQNISGIFSDSASRGGQMMGESP